MGLRGFHEGAIELDGDAAPKKLDRHDDEALLGIRSDKDSLHLGEWSVGDAHSLPFPEIGIGEDRKPRTDELLNGVDLRIRDNIELVPAFPEQTHQPARLADLEKARLVHGMAHENIAAE